jgi:pilus assembly protein CpaB
MKNLRKLPLIVGLVLALGTAVLLVDYLSSVHASAATAKSRDVYVAVRDIPARSLLTDAFVRHEQRPAAGVDGDAIVSRTDLVGKYALITIPEGSILTRSKIGTGGAGALPARLPVGMRAVSISIDRVKGVAGLIQPGDRVDVIAVPPRVGSEVPQAAAILRGVLVLAMGNEVETVSATPGPDNQNLTTVTLALTPRQVDLLAAADLNTTLRLALRSPKEPIRAYPPEPLTLGAPDHAAPPMAVIAPQAGVTTPQRSPAVGPAPVAAAPAATEHSVQLIDGDRVVDGSTHR